jgi:2-oxoglutarate dehydrogenase E2 component (dihydrolipoamide succinyltransferase)
MRVEIKIPAIGESITEVQIGAWLKAVGDVVRQDDPLVSIETDKATIELPAPASGRITQTMKQAGETATVGEVIGYLEGEPMGAMPAGRTSPPDTATSATPTPAVVEAAVPTAAGLRVMPAAQRLLAEHGVDTRAVTPTELGGRLLKEDVLHHLEATLAPATTTAPPREASAGPARPESPRGATGREDKVVPMSMLRRRVAERLVQAQQAGALLTTVNEIDMSAVITLRRSHQEAFQQRYQAKLGFMSFFVKAAVGALRLVPELNAEIRGTDIVYRSYHDIGVAVGSPKGLVVPVLRNADVLSFGDIEQAIADFARRAQAAKLTLDELHGGTFTISNGGVYGSLLSTPIVNPPQSGILGLHVVQDRPVARDGQVVIRPMMYVALTYDHRIVDGQGAVTFLTHIKACVEEPARVLLEI